MLTKRAFRIFVCALAAMACEGARREPTGAVGGTIVIAAHADPDALFPPDALNMEARQATELIYEYLADVGPAMNTIGDSGFTRQLAADWTWGRDSSSLAFSLDPGARWHDGVRVTSADVAFSHSVYADEATGSMLASTLAYIDSVSTPDSLTAVFWFSRRDPRQFYVAAATMLILPHHLFGGIPGDSLRAAGAARDPVGTGKYRLARWSRGTSLELAAVEDHYRGRAGPDRLIWSITPEYRPAIMRLIAGEADVFAHVRQETLPELAAAGFDLVSLPGMDYVFMQLNLRDASGSRPHPLFRSPEVRRALTMAIDRDALVKNLFDTLASVSIGPAVRAFPATDTALRQIRFDPPAAERLLDSLGFRISGSNGIRSRGALPLRFRILVPVSSLSRMRIAVLIQEQLRRVGADAVIEQMDYSAFSARQAARDFDAALASWHLGSSPEAVRVTWTGDAAKPGGLNYGGYSNAVFDALVDSALSETTLDGSREYFRRANQLIVDDAPAVWLYEPKTLLAIHGRITPSPMRANAWWLDIGSWKIDPAKRLPRDMKAGKGSQDLSP
ncbi:MAG: peptide ABC transporter substrate-binding protein [Gemmatimonadaceae bacterium]